MRRLPPMLAALVMASGWGEAGAAYISVDLNASTNEDFRSSPYQTVASLPVGGTAITLGGTPFTLATYNGQAGTTGVVQTGPFDFSSSAPNSVAIAVNIAGATEVDTLINSTFGSLGQLSGQVQFFGTGGAFASFDLVQGVNIRDYNAGSVFNNAIAPGTNTVTYTSSTPTPGGTYATRLDEQTFALPASFAVQTLTTIELVDASSSIFTGPPLLAAATVVTAASAVPTPGSAVLLGIAATLGLGATPLGRRPMYFGHRQPHASAPRSEELASIFRPRARASGRPAARNSGGEPEPGWPPAGTQDGKGGPAGPFDDARG